MPQGEDFEVGKPRVVRRSPVSPASKLCPKCLQPLQRGSRLGGWLVPQDYYCTQCGYHGTVYLEPERKAQGEGEQK